MTLSLTETIFVLFVAILLFWCTFVLTYLMFNAYMSRERHMNSTIFVEEWIKRFEHELGKAIGELHEEVTMMRREINLENTRKEFMERCHNVTPRSDITAQSNVDTNELVNDVLHTLGETKETKETQSQSGVSGVFQ